MGIPAAFILLAATGVLRAQFDTRTPILVFSSGFGANAVLNVILVLGLDWGLIGSALGTVCCQISMATAMVWVLRRRMSGRGLSTTPSWGHIRSAARGGLALIVRTLSLRAALLVTAWVAADNVQTLGTYQVTMAVWVLLSFLLDALAIAGQPLIARALGAGDAESARQLMHWLTRFGAVAGLVLGGIIALSSPWIPWIFTDDQSVHSGIRSALLVIAIAQPLAGVVFVLDGVLLGAGDTSWLAYTGIAQFLGYLPVAIFLQQQAVQPALIWWGFSWYMLLRGLFLGYRAHGSAWLQPRH